MVASIKSTAAATVQSANSLIAYLNHLVKGMLAKPTNPMVAAAWGRIKLQKPSPKLKARTAVFLP